MIPRSGFYDFHEMELYLTEATDTTVDNFATFRCSQNLVWKCLEYRENKGKFKSTSFRTDRIVYERFNLRFAR